MAKLDLPRDYRPIMDIRRTEVAIKRLKDLFEPELAAALNLTRVSAPLFVPVHSGLNDQLSGKERPVGFTVGETGEEAEIVHSLAKWKRHALKRYGFAVGEGLYTDMNAIRRDEVADELHSIYVDQWDWELIIDPRARTEERLHRVVERIYSAMLRTESMLCSEFYELSPSLPPRIAFTTAQALEDRWPELSPKQREHAVCRESGAVFIQGIGGALRSGEKHDDRAPDYDDWSLNGDILLYYPPLDCAMEMSSMGIRVDPDALRRQLDISGRSAWAKLPFHEELLRGDLPQTMGGGIGQSRLCMFFLRKAHIGEVQSSLWPQGEIERCRACGATLL